MEPNWGLYNNYYSGDRPPPVSPPQDRVDEGPSHRRMTHGHGNFLPPPPPVNLPPVSTSYPGTSYHGSSPSTVGMESGSTSGAPHSASAMHMTPTMPYSGHMSMSQQVGTYHYPVQQSPATMSALPPRSSGQPHGYSPRVPGGYPSASPTMNPLSPLSPSTHLGGYAGPSSGSTSSFPPSVPPPHSRVDLPSIAEHRKRRTTSDSGGSWDEQKDDDEQPWGMPQEQYKALNPRDKKQVRNRIGARRFRAKRKDYVSQLEAAKKESDRRIVQLEGQLETSWREINDLRARLNMPPLPPPDVGSSSNTTLGLVVGSGE